MKRFLSTIFFALLVLHPALVAQQDIYVTPLQSAELVKSPIIKASTAAGLLAVSTMDKTVKVFDISTLTERCTLKDISNPATLISLTASGKFLITSTTDGQLTVWDSRTGLLAKALAHPSTPYTAIAAQDEPYVYAANSDKKLTILDALTGNALGTVNSAPDDVTGICLHPNGKDFAVGSSSGQVRIYSLSGLSVTKALLENKEKVSSISFSPSGRLLIAGTAGGTVYIWETQSWTLKKTLSQDHRAITSIAFDLLSQWFATSSADSALRVYDLASFARVKLLTEPSGYYVYTSFINSDTLLACISNGIVKKWRVLATPPDTMNPTAIVLQPQSPTDEPVKTLAIEYEIRGIAYDDGEVGSILVNGKQAKLLPAASEDVARAPAGMKVKRFSADVKLENVGLNKFEIKTFDKAAHTTTQEVTFRRLSIDQSVEIIAPENNAVFNAVSTPLQFKPWFEVERYSIAVNLSDIPTNAVPPGKSVGDVIQDEIPLVVGDNQIQLTVVGKQGERFTKSMTVGRKAADAISTNGPSATQKKLRGSGPQAWAVVVGLSEYGNSGIPSLKYADRDAEAFADFLRRPEGGGYDSDHLQVLLNKDATLPKIKDVLINFLGQAIDIDLVIIYFAGHGAPEPARPQNLYLLTYDTDPNILGTTAFPMWQIQDVLGRYINAKRVVVFSDACHSGGISVNFATRGMGVSENNLINQYLADLSKTKEGTVVFTASAAGEVSQEFPELGHGVFTYYLLEGLQGKADFNNDYVITINEAMQYVEEQVKRKTKGAQNPTRSQTSYDKDLTIATIAH